MVLKMHATMKLTSTSAKKFVRSAYRKKEIMNCCCVIGAMTLITETAWTRQFRMSLKYGFAQSVNNKMHNSRSRKVYI